LNLHVVVDLDFGEKSHVLGLKTERDVSAAITTGTLDTFPVLDSGQNNIDELPEEVEHILTAQFRLHRDGVSARRNTPSRNTGLRFIRLNADIGNSLNGHTGDMKPGRVLLSSLLDVAVDGDALELGYVVESDGFAEQS
jgi:hypothetical protein